MKSITTLLITAVLAATAANAQIAQDEREALIDFYEATGGENWTDNTNWLDEPGTECDWYGVLCAGWSGQTPFVRRLRLPDNGLVGGLPESLVALDHLEDLVLADNQLSGAIPADLWELPSSLQTLDLGRNLFSGPIPSAILDLQDGESVWRVDLSGNQMTDFDSEGVPAAALTPKLELRLNDNLIDQLPPQSWRETGALQTLEMAGNQIEGSVNLSGTWPGLERLDLSDNAISAVAASDGEGPADLSTLDLADNELSAWPGFLPSLDSLVGLDLSNNALVGELPDWFDQLDLGELDLDHNQLNGPIAAVFEGLDLDGYPKPRPPFGELGLHLHLANNAFTGSLPDIDFSRFNRPTQASNPEFGLDLCFNEIDMPDDAVLDAIAPAHRGRGLAACLGRSQAMIGRDVSGSWYVPSRAGEGTTLMMLDNGRLLQYWFTHAPGDGLINPRQQWFVGVTEPATTWGEFRPLTDTFGGRFGMGLADGEAGPSSTWIRQNRIDEDTLHFLYDYRGGGICITGGCSVTVDSDRFDQQRLTELAGTTCENQSPFQEYSGAWYNPDKSGEGFVVEVLPDDRVVAYWFTHRGDDSGQQAWMIGDGTFPEGILLVDPPVPVSSELSLYQPTGTAFGADFNSEDIEIVDWGTLTLTFFVDGGGQVEWDSNLPEYGSGSYPIERLARPMLADCE